MRESGSSSLLTLLILLLLVWGVVQLGPSIKKQVYQNARESIGRASRVQDLEREVSKLKKDLAKYKKVEEENEIAKLKKELEEARGALAKKKESEELAARKAARMASVPRKTQTIVRSTYVQPRYVTVERAPPPPVAPVETKSPSAASTEMKAPDLPSEAAVTAKRETAAAKAAAMREKKEKARAKARAAKKAEEEEEDEDFFSDMDE